MTAPGLRCCLPSFADRRARQKTGTQKKTVRGDGLFFRLTTNILFQYSEFAFDSDTIDCFAYARDLAGYRVLLIHAL